MDISFLDEGVFRCVCKDSATNFCMQLSKIFERGLLDEFGYTLNLTFLCIAKEGASKCMRALLKHNKFNQYIKPDTVDEQGNSALILAIDNYHIELASILLNDLQTPYIIDRTLRNNRGETALDVACEKGLTSLLDMLTHEWTISDHISSERPANNSNSYFYTAIITAVDAEKHEILEHLVKRGIDINLNEENDLGTALHCAAENGSTSLVKKLLSIGADVEALRRRHMQTPLMLACQYGHLETVQALVERGSIIDKQTKKCSTALTLACHYGFEDIAYYLIDQGADPSISNNWGFTALYMSTDSPRILEKILYNSSININKQCGERLETPLHLASVIGCVESFNLLVNVGADTELLTEFNESALWLAIWKQHHDIAKLCIQFNSNHVLNTASNGCEVYAWKYSPLELAIGSGQFDVAVQLHLAGAKFSHHGNDNKASSISSEDMDRLEQFPDWITIRKEVLLYVLTDKHVFQWLKHCAWNPRTLFGSCIITIRHSILSKGYNYLMDIDSLPLPYKLKMGVKLQS